MSESLDVKLILKEQKYCCELCQRAHKIIWAMFIINDISLCRRCSLLAMANPTIFGKLLTREKFNDYKR